MSEEQARYIPEKPEPHVAIVDRVAALLVKAGRRYKPRMAPNGWILIDTTTDAAVYRGSFNECQQEKGRLMAEAVMTLLAEDQPPVEAS